MSISTASDFGILSTPKSTQDITSFIENQVETYIRVGLSFATKDSQPLSSSQYIYTKIESKNKNNFLAYLRSGCTGKNQGETYTDKSTMTEFNMIGLSMVIIKLSSLSN